MEPLYLAECIYDEAFYCEIYRKLVLLFDAHVKRAFLSRALCFLPYACSALAAKLWIKRDMLFLITIVMAGIYFLYGICTWRKRSAHAFAETTSKKLGGKAPVRRAAFQENGFLWLVKETQIETFFPYRCIVKLRETEHYYLMLDERRKYFVVDKRNFQIGNSDEFRTFIQEKIAGNHKR